MRALWERLNHQRWTKTENDDREYVLHAFEGDVEMPDQSDEDDDDDIPQESQGTASPIEGD